MAKRPDADAKGVYGMLPVEGGYGAPSCFGLSVLPLKLLSKPKLRLRRFEKPSKKRPVSV